jgi:hypothetical protein
VGDYKPELGFNAIDRLTLTPLTTPPTFKPTVFKNSTLKGNLDVDNGYPFETTRVPLANVYKIQEIPIDLNTTETPRKIAKNLGFTREPVTSTSTTQTWSEGNKELEINGQYLLIKYKNNAIRKGTTNGDPLLLGDSNSLKSVFSDVLRSYGIISDLENYKFRVDRVDYDKSLNEFVFNGSSTTSSFIRINAERQYPSLFKEIDTVTTNATYPNRLHSNTYVVIPATLPRGATMKEYIAELNLYNWPIAAKDKNDKNVQTYNIKSPRKAFDELQNANKYLMAVSEITLQGDTRKPFDVDELSGIDRVDVFRIRLEMYEDLVNTTYIQPVYVFICQAESNGKLLELVYYVPALADAVTK